MVNEKSAQDLNINLRHTCMLPLKNETEKNNESDRRNICVSQVFDGYFATLILNSP